MSRRLFHILIILGFWLATTLPQIIGWAHTSPTLSYLGRIPSNPADTAAYYSNIEQAKQGRPVFANQLTSEPQRPSLFHPLWLVTGWIAWVAQLSAPVAFQVVRLLAIILFVLFLDRLLVWLFSEARTQNLAMMVVLTSSGLGWLFARSAYVGSAILTAPIDLWVDEANTFRSLSHSALFVVSQLLLFIVLWRLYRWTQAGRQRGDWLLGPVLLLLGLIHPYDLVTAGSMTLVWVVVWMLVSRPSASQRRGVVVRIVQAWIWVVPVAVYYVVGPLREVAVRGWFVQNINLSPKPLALLIGYGLLWPLAVIGGVTSWKKFPWVKFATVWIVTVMVLTYFPGLSIQRRLLSGVHLPIALLATLGISWCIQRGILRQWQTATTVLVVVFLATMNIKHIQADIRGVLHPTTVDYSVYLRSDEQAAVDWLRSNTNIDDVVMASMWDGNTITGLAGRPVVVAHGNQTVNANERERDWESFRDGTTSSVARQEIVQRLRVRWLYWTSDDQKITTYHPADDRLWRPVLVTPTVTVFALQLN